MSEGFFVRLHAEVFNASHAYTGPHLISLPPQAISVDESPLVTDAQEVAGQSATPRAEASAASQLDLQQVLGRLGHSLSTEVLARLGPNQVRAIDQLLSVEQLAALQLEVGLQLHLDDAQFADVFAVACERLSGISTREEVQALVASGQISHLPATCNLPQEDIFRFGEQGDTATAVGLVGDNPAIQHRRRNWQHGPSFKDMTQLSRSDRLDRKDRAPDVCGVQERRSTRLQALRKKVEDQSPGFRDGPPPAEPPEADPERSPAGSLALSSLQAANLAAIASAAAAEGSTSEPSITGATICGAEATHRGPGVAAVIQGA